MAKARYELGWALKANTLRMERDDSERLMVRSRGYGY